MIIREARADDAAVIARFNIAMALETEARHLDEPTVQRGVAGGLARPDLCRYHLAELDGAVVGQLMITYEWSDWRNGVFWWIQSVYVDPAYRGRGVFKQLYRHVESMARAAGGVCGLRLYVEHENAAAQRCYQQLGLKATGYRIYEADWSNFRGSVGR